MKKALIAMSGGVDSTVAAFLALEAGYDCAGGTMRLFSGEETDAARDAAGRLGIPFHLFDFSEDFSRMVTDKFIEDYCAGRTPNPCIGCNRFLKFGRLLDEADKLGFDAVATGHYARVEREGERYLLKKGTDPAKDQSYVLYTLTQRQLSRVLFPLGGMTKEAARKIAAERGFPNAGQAESQDICFVPDGDYAAFIERETGGTFPKGRFTDTVGNDLGEHRGVIHYTVGQRRGLGISTGQPLYVKEIRANTVVVGRAEELFSPALTADNVNLIAPERLHNPLTAKVRYRHPGQPAAAALTDGGRLRVEFETPQRAVTPGQAVVLYDGDVVVGGGTIE